MVLKLGEPFGLDISAMTDAAWDLIVNRIISDIKSDFIFAPHVRFAYSKAKSKILEDVKSELKSGKFLPGIPITMEVPKSNRMKVGSQPPRPGPNFSRPGSILLPKDRVVYQLFADFAEDIVDEKTDPTRSFSHKKNIHEPEKMFVQTRECWSSFQKALNEYSDPDAIKYVLKLDVANFFGSLNQHTLVNVLDDAGYPSPLVARLEIVLTSFTGDRSSRGILQGIFPSDLFGNFYLEPIDSMLADLDVKSARYVDDLYVFVSSVDEADSVVRQLIPVLRRYDLSINEAKSLVIPKNKLHTEEPDLEALFQSAIEEISAQIEDSDFDTEYGFQAEWDDEEEEEEGESDELGELELEATKLLFDSAGDYPGHEENIERFCLPLFAKVKSEYGVAHTLDSLKKRPSMAQIYCVYLAKFIDEDVVFDALTSALDDDTLYDWQRMWIIASLLQNDPKNDAAMKIILKIFKDGRRHEAVRAVAAIFIGRHGDATRRRGLCGEYANVSPYVRSAIYYSSITWPGVERANAKANWGNQDYLNQVISFGMQKIKK